MMKKIFCLFIVIFTIIACNKISEVEKEKIYKEKGFYDMPNTLKPEILKNIPKYYGLVEINKRNSVATLNGSGDFSILTFDKFGNVSLKPIVKGFPPHPGDSIHSDPENDLLWQIRGRGVYILDLETKKTAHVIASSNPNDEITNNHLLNSKKNIFYFGLVNHGIQEPPYSSYTIYDVFNHTKIFESQLISGNLYPITQNELLFIQYYNKGKQKKWYITDLYMNELKENKLTQELTKLQISKWPYSKTIHQERRMMLGTSRLTGTLEYFSIRWDEDFEDVKIEPIIVQRSKGGLLSSAFVFSPAGKWVKTDIEFINTAIETPRLLFYAVNDMYPQGLSMPIVCGYTGEYSPGAFMDHEEWGPCYLEQDIDYPDKIFIYKLNDGLKLLAEQAANAIGQ
ncbi:MAG: hypothetical protein JXJ04_23495 [Spirochaetales bacterium]|nr:hypothetical protein [Spirochaetales bacterium]